ncbi:hypothetical protein IQ238_01715 [Pleurocapsales cyanobacterium LEGE 06147]|nr:hypothetical protein [Pleurocapsales cyanobacterium LEGE 06147]
MLCECIHIDRKRLNRHRFIPQRISFHFNKDNLKEFQEARAKNQQLLLSPALLADFRYYVLLNQYNYFQSGLTFCTYYQEREQEIAIVQSVISLEGKIEQQIRRDRLDNSCWLNSIISIHYWSLAQMFDQLPLQPTNYSDWLFWGLALPIIIAIAFFSFQLLDIFPPILLLALIVVSWLFQKCSKNLLLPYLRTWILRQLLFGIFSYPSGRRKIGFELLSLIND